MDPEKLIQAAASRAVEALSGAATGQALALGGKVWGWLRGKLTGDAAQRAAAVEAAPGKASAKPMIAALLHDLLEEKPELAKELLALLGGEAGVQAVQTATVTGGGTVTQIAGSGNTIGKLR
jgi:hypothetical protein